MPFSLPILTTRRASDSANDQILRRSSVWRWPNRGKWVSLSIGNGYHSLVLVKTNSLSQVLHWPSQDGPAARLICYWMSESSVEWGCIWGISVSEALGFGLFLCHRACSIEIDMTNHVISNIKLRLPTHDEPRKSLWILIQQPAGLGLCDPSHGSLGSRSL